MGTNYYTKIGRCPTCGRCEEKIHLGKSSGGWRFTFQYNDGKYYKNEKEMREWLKGKQIWDENKEKVSYQKFWKMIQDKKKEKLNHGEKYPDYCIMDDQKNTFYNVEFS